MSGKTAQQHNAQNFDLGEMIRQMGETHARMARIGMDAVEQRYATALRALDAGYRAAEMDPEAKIPSYLMAAIHALLTIRDIDAQNRFANEMIKREQIERHEGRPEHDMNTRGGMQESGR